MPPGKGGRARPNRAQPDWNLSNVCRDTSLLENRLIDEIALWKVDFNWVPRPMARGEKFFLVFCSGHRRWGDISSWFHWEGTITPVAIDLAVCKNHGDIQGQGGPRAPRDKQTPWAKDYLMLHPWGLHIT